LKYIHIQTPCPPGWGCEERMTVKIGKMAIECGLFDLYEIEGDQKTLSEPTAKLLKKDTLRPVEDYLKMQTRFKALSDEQIDTMQQKIDRKWETYRQEFAEE